MKSCSAILFILPAIAVSFFSCQSEGKPPAASAAPQPAAPAKPEVHLYATTVDKLNLREEPHKNGKVVAQLPEGAFVEGTGEVSANKEEANLRGVNYLEPYIKVTAATPEKPAGWAFGGALKPVYSGARSSAPDLAALGQFTAFLKTLDAKKMDSGKKAWDYVQSNFASASGPLADAAFVLLEAFLFRMEGEGDFYKMTEQINWGETDYEAVSNNTFDPNKYPVTKSLAANGFDLSTGEGMVFPVVDWNKLRDFFSPKVTPATKAYLEQETIENNEQAWDDGGIIISLEKLADRAAFWEKFNRDYPYFILHEQTRESERWTRLVLVNGADNTPVYDPETLAINEASRKAWDYIQQKYPGTELARVSKEIADLCAAEGWKRTKKVEDWQTKFAETSYQ